MGLLGNAKSDKPLRLSDLVRPIPRQREFLDALFSGVIKFLLYGGAAGGGKSYILRWAAVLFLIKAFAIHGIRQCIVGLFCENFPQLKQRQIAKISTEFPRWLGSVKESKEFGFAFVLAPRFGGGIILLCNLDDPNKYDSVEFAAVFVDELTKNPESIFDELRKRLRWPRIWMRPHFPCGGFAVDKDGVKRPCDGTYEVIDENSGEVIEVRKSEADHSKEFIHPFAAGTNPGSLGHAWVKKYWVDGDLPPWLKKYAHQFAFVRSFAKDNPYNPESYFEELKSLPPLLAKAYADGNWDLFVGQFFSEWRDELHRIKSFEIPSYWHRGWGGDWGWSSPFAGITIAINPNQDIFVYRQVYAREKPASWLGGELSRLHEGEKMEKKVLDPSCFSKEPGRDYAEQLGKAGWECERADNDRINGWNVLREYLAWEKDENEVLVTPPKFFVFDNSAIFYGVQESEALHRAMPALVFDEGTEDCETDGVPDHGPDATRYIVKTRPKVVKIPTEILAADWQEAVRRAARREERERSA